jgi:RNA polymerase sigma-70 factor (ECF subfamily)
VAGAPSEAGRGLKPAPFTPPLWNFIHVRTEIITEAMMVIDDAPDAVPDKVLLQRALEGDERAFTALYRRRQGGIYRFAMQMTGSIEAAEDVTQETFLAVLGVGSRYEESRGTVAAFLYGIARKLVLRRLERGRGPDRGCESDSDASDCTSGEDILGDLTRQETIEQVRSAVLRLPAVYREAVVLCDLQDLSYQEAAAALECPVGTVRSRLNRARALLKQRLSIAGVCVHGSSRT